MGEQAFKLQSLFEPAGDQPEAIRKLTEGLRTGAEHQTLLGVTGSGKTFTVANVKSCYVRSSKHDIPECKDLTLRCGAILVCAGIRQHGR